MDMSYRRLGASGLMVSPLCLGTMMFGAQTDAAEAGRIMSAARDTGINFIDTANVYNKGESERVTGALIGRPRQMGPGEQTCQPVWAWPESTRERSQGGASSR